METRMNDITNKPDVAEEVVWLKSLKDELRRMEQGEMTPNMGGRTILVGVPVQKRKLTPEELERLVRIAPLFVVKPETTEYGFNFGLSFYQEYEGGGNGIPITPQFVFSISGSYLPRGMDDHFSGAWKTLSPLSHNNENEQKLKWYEFEPLQKKEHYEY